MATPQPGQQGGPGGVVIEHKKGEVNELKTSLRNPSLDRDPDKKREVIKRVIAYMTLGIDVSKLFSEMIMVSTALRREARHAHSACRVCRRWPPRRADPARARGGSTA